MKWCPVVEGLKQKQNTELRGPWHGYGLYVELISNTTKQELVLFYMYAWLFEGLNLYCFYSNPGSDNW